MLTAVGSAQFDFDNGPAPDGLSRMIHPTAIIEDGVQLGADCDIRAGAILCRGTVLGDRVTVHPYAVIGGEPQDLRFDPSTVSGVRIGSGTTIREHVTIHRSTQSGGCTEVGENCFLMAGSHVGHDCHVGNHVILANQAMLAGHVTVGDYTFMGGGAAAHQNGRIGAGVMVGGLSRIALDIPPFVMVAERNEISGLNLVGLRRRGVSRETIAELKDAFRAIYGIHGNIREIAAGLLPEAQSPEVTAFLEFFTAGKRGIARASRRAFTGDE